jgi:hypothetical protein
LGRGKSPHTLELVRVSKEILAEIHPATVRAVCYQLFVVHKLIPSMAKAETNKVSTHLTWPRLQGIIPWEWIVDEHRRVERASMWEDPAAYVETVKHAYRRDYWQQQPRQVIVVSEKGTVRGMLAPVLDEYGVGFLPMHGYASTTKVHDVAEDSWQPNEQPLLVVYVGDWDPSGMDMSENDQPRRLAAHQGNVEIVRVALTTTDIADPALPSFPVDDKKKDPRYKWFIAHYGRRCWELDALDPRILRSRVEDAIREVIDWAA